jgi:hypothetical protein
MKVAKQLAAAGGMCLLALATNAARADVLLTFNVTNVQQNVCGGSIQPGCYRSAAPQADFMETMRIAAGAPLGASGSGPGPSMQSQAFFGFPAAFTGSPYTHALKQWLSGPVTDRTAFTELDSSYDSGAAAGISSALLVSDAISDVTDANGFRFQQEYKHALNVSTGLFDDAAYYTDLVNQSLIEFFSKYVGKMTGSFDELGSASRFDPHTLALDPYLFAEYTGDATLFAVQEVPEPATLASLAIAGLAFVAVVRRGKRAGSATV